MDLATTDLAYAAGVIDSDGWIGIRRQRSRNANWQTTYAARAMVKQVTPQAVDLLHSLFGGYRGVGAGTETRRPLHTWEVHSAAAVRACSAVLPYLRIKREQAENAVRVGDLLIGRSRTWELPEVVEGEPLLPLLEAARRAGRSPAVAYQSASLGNIPCVRSGGRVFVPASFVDTWRARPAHPPRASDLTDRLEQCYQRGRDLNVVGVR